MLRVIAADTRSPSLISPPPRGQARTASYIPYTRGAQDVIETIFPTQVSFAPWPLHVHAFKGVVDYKACSAMTRKRLHDATERAAFEATDARLLSEERRLIAKLPGRKRGDST